MTTTPREHCIAIMTAESLDDLLSALRAAEDALKDAAEAIERPDWYNEFGGGIEQQMDVDLTGLPIFGGETPADTTGIYSWDETRVLCADPVWMIESRDD